jgi:hypothetical protein
MDQTLEQLVDNVARYLKQGVTDSRIRKGLKNNNWDEQIFDQALRMAKTRLRQEEAVAQEAAKLAEEAKHPSKAKKHHKKDSPKDSSSQSAPTAPLPQDEAILLHQAVEAALPVESERQSLPKDIESGGTYTYSNVASSKLELPQEYPEFQRIQEGAQTIADFPDLSAFYPPAPYGPTPWQQLQQPQQPYTTSAIPPYPYNPPVWPAQIPPSPTVGNFYPANPANPMFSQPSFGYGNQPPIIASPGLSFNAHLPQGMSGYPVVQALKDAYQAVKANIVTYILTVFVCAVMASALFFFTHMMVEKFMPLHYNFLLTAPTKLLGIMLGSFVLYSTACVLLGALVIAVTSVAIYSSGAQKRKSSINVVLSKSMGKIGIVGAATALLTILTFVPAVLGILLPVTFLLMAHAAASLSYVLPLLYLLAMAWVTFVSRRYALVPYIALFERDVSLGQMLVNSRHLLADGGRRFMTQATLGALALLLLATYLSGGSLRHLSNKVDIYIVIFAGIISLIINAILVMLYRNQKSLEQ